MAGWKWAEARTHKRCSSEQKGTGSRGGMLLSAFRWGQTDRIGPRCAYRPLPGAMQTGEWRCHGSLLSRGQKMPEGEAKQEKASFRQWKERGARRLKNVKTVLGTPKRKVKARGSHWSSWLWTFFVRNGNKSGHLIWRAADRHISVATSRGFSISKRPQPAVQQPWVLESSQAGTATETETHRKPATITPGQDSVRFVS